LGSVGEEMECRIDQWLKNTEDSKT
jgi:hypothetical protein